MQSYELVGREDVCHTKHWILFVCEPQIPLTRVDESLSDVQSLTGGLFLQLTAIDWLLKRLLTSSSTTDQSTNGELDCDLD